MFSESIIILLGFTITIIAVLTQLLFCLLAPCLLFSLSIECLLAKRDV